MSKIRFLLALPAISLVSLALAYPSASQEPLLKESDLRKAAGALGEYLEEGASSEAESSLKEEMDKLARKLAKTPAEGDIMRSPSDLGYMFWLSYEYSKQRAQKGKVAEEEFIFDRAGFTKKEPLEYAVWAPSKYSAKKGPYPLILCLHDEGQTATQHLTEDWVDNDLREGAIIAIPQMPEDTSTWTAEGPKYVLTLMKAVTETYAVDFNRIYLAGKGVGLLEAFAVAGKFPDRWAGLIGRAGDLGDDVVAINFSNLPTFLTGAGAKATAFRDAANELEIENVTLQPDGLEADIWNWIQATTRSAYPDSVRLSPGSPMPYRSSWLEVPASNYNGKATIEARLDRDANAVHVEGSGVTDFVLYLNDDLLDLSRPITVHANGQESSIQVSRSFKSFLNLIYNGRSDPGRVFVASQSFHLPAAGEGSR